MNTSFSALFCIRYKVILLVLFYLFFMLSYFIALTTSFSDYARDSQLSLRNLIPETFDYVLKFIVTIPIWYLIFRKFKNAVF
jgi:hypothetical protein